MDIIEKYGKPLLEDEDILIAEKIVAITQGRAMLMK